VLGIKLRDLLGKSSTTELHPQSYQCTLRKGLHAHTQTNNWDTRESGLESKVDFIFLHCLLFIYFFFNQLCNSGLRLNPELLHGKH
jgi:hypothetical protein